eukprot:6976808-Alexandrium_andersonii.AAC.1
MGKRGKRGAAASRQRSNASKLSPAAAGARAHLRWALGGPRPPQELDPANNQTDPASARRSPAVRRCRAPNVLSEQALGSAA